MINVLLIDLDGTLVESVAGIHLACVEMVEQLRLPSPPEPLVRRSIGRGADALIQTILKEMSGGTVDPALQRRGRRIYDDAYLEAARRGTVLRPFASEALDALTDLGCEAVIATNKPGPAASMIIEGLGLGDRVASIVTPDSAGVRKPDPKFINSALEGRSVAQAILIGDSDIDAETAKRADIPFIALSGGYNAGIPISESEIGNTGIATSWREVPGLVADVLRRGPLGFEESD